MSINVKSVIEAALFIVGSDGVHKDKLKSISRLPESDFNAVIDEMIVEYEKDSQRGLLLKKVGDYYKLFTKPEIAKIISVSFGIKQKNPLNQAMIETLAIVVYNEPCTRSKIHELRKTDPTPMLEKLIEIGLVEEAGRSEAVGKPYLYQVTPKFYDTFGIDSIKDLPEIIVPEKGIEELTYEEEINFFDTNREDNNE
ncbi:MAG: SMC-Scp complex subunit ScpB [Malacoplasma sp.]|nr:SMC-Scp complex subunit ScpB [Malacoplasma sp.]